MSGYSLHSLSNEHIPAIKDLIDRLFETPWTRQALQQHFGAPTNSAIGAFDQQTLIGFLLIQYVFPTVDILLIGIDPSHQRQGIGRTLLQNSLNALHTQGARRVLLEVKETDQTAQAFYKYFGFQVIARRPHYYKTSKGLIDALILERLLD